MIEEFLKNHNQPSYRLKQFNKHFYQDAVSSFDEITTWPKDLREKLKASVPFSTLELERTYVSSAKDVVKFLFNRVSGAGKIETVLMRHKDGRNTVCVSCMVGCPVGCTFCATGKMGFIANLSAIEIIDQIMYCKRLLKTEGRTLTNIVYMGMGEPMLNLEAVEGSINILTDPDKMAMSDRRITVSTSGYLPQLRTFFMKGYRGRLAISLHASNQKLREKLMRVAKVYKMDELLRVMDEYVELTNKRITYEYIMLDKVNDSEENARELGEMFANRLAHINIIPFNTVTETPYKRSARERIDSFVRVLSKFGVTATVRVSMGEGMEAACGQLSSISK